MAIVRPNYVGQNWTITPAAPGPNEPAPRNFSEQKWVWVLTGVAVVDIPGNNPHDWRRGGVRINPNAWESAAQAMMDRYGVHGPTSPRLSLDLWAPFVAVSSFLDTNKYATPPSGAGVAVDLWRPAPFGDAQDIINNVTIRNAYRGIDVDLAVYGQAVLHRLSYNITLLGKIFFGYLGAGSPEPTI
jgi:hypothetical protein